jgi:Tol biopolymer transport system component
MPSTSPDGKWKATVLEDQESASLRVSSTDGSVVWIADTVTERDIYGGFEWPIPFHWSKDGRYLYFTHHERGDGCISLFHGSDLQRLDLQTGEVTEIIPRVGYWLALSPDETTLAYLSFEKGLILHDLPSGDERQVHLDIEDAYPETPLHKSHLLWSPNGNLLVLTIDIDVCGPGWSTAIVQVDVATLSQTVLLHEDEKLLYTIEWLEANRILLWEEGGHLWWLDTTTGTVTTAE